MAILLGNIGHKTYCLLRNLTAPTAPKDKSFEDLSTLLNDPAPLVIAERYRFHQRKQQGGETKAEYVETDS